MLIDCGLSVRRLTLALKEFGMEPRDLAGLFITHEHTDHVKAMCLVTPFAQKFNVPVYASRGFWRWYSAYSSRLDKDLVKVIASGEEVDFSGVRVKAFAKPHDALEPLGFVVEISGERAGFAMDLGHVTAEVKRNLRGLEHLIIESNHDVEMEKNSGRPRHLIERVLGKLGHLSNEQAAEALCELVTAGTRQVILAHLSTECNTPEKARSLAVERLAEAGWEVPVRVAPYGEVAVYS
ncbi:MAG TPA: MBL fold metallo-hydrolase [Firmicutes bacterium]|nr:MBL fold metallo-hydrolase [Candidatus Fermentithermobacillaceae bacterium]